VLHQNKWHPYKLHIVQQLYEEDIACRARFAEDELERLAQNPGRLKRLAFSDEAHFHLDGNVNRYNHRYWSLINPKWMQEESLHSPRTTVWAAIWEGGVIGPLFFEETVNGARYLDMLKNQFWPALLRLRLEKELVFMQDGAPPHFAKVVTTWLNEKFPGRWMGRGSPNMPWAPRSPDITPCDFFLWGFIKSIVYETRPVDIQDLKDRIKNAFGKITAEMRKKTFEEYHRRLMTLVENGGVHVEV